MNTALMKILIPMLPNQLKTKTTPLVALTRTQASQQSTAGKYVVEDVGSGEDEVDGDWNNVESNAAVSKVSADSRVLVAPVDDEDFELVDGDCNSNLINKE